MSGPSRPQPGNSATQELALMRALLTEGQEAQNVILRSLEVDMRDVRDRLTMIEAKELIQRIDIMEEKQRLTVAQIHDLKESAEHRQAVLRRLEALERIQTEATGMARLARWLWIGFTALSAGGIGLVMSKLFGVSAPHN